MSRPRLLVLTSTLPRWPGDTEPAFVESLCLELADVFDVTVLAPHARGALRDEVIERDGRTIAVHRFRYFFTALQTLAYEGGIVARIRSNPLRVLLVPFFIVAQLLAVSRMNRSRRFDVMHAHWLIPQGVVAAAYRAMSRTSPPFLVTSHGTDLQSLHGALMTRVKQRVMRRATRISVVSTSMRDKAVAIGGDGNRIVVRSMGVDLRSTFTPGGQERSGLVFVGRLVDVKGVGILLDAMRILTRDRPDLRLTIAGHGPLRTDLERRIGELGLDDNVRFSGALPGCEVAESLRRALVCVMPSVVAASGAEEGFGLVAVEAMGCECAVVASDLPGIRDAVVDGQTGLLATSGDADTLADRIAVLLEDGGLRHDIVARARRFAIEKFDWSVVGQRYAELLLEVIRDD